MGGGEGTWAVLCKYYNYSKEKNIYTLDWKAVKKLKLRNSAFCHAIKLCVWPTRDFVDRDGAGGIATRHGVDGLGIETR